MRPDVARRERVEADLRQREADWKSLAAVAADDLKAPLAAVADDSQGAQMRLRPPARTTTPTRPDAVRPPRTARVRNPSTYSLWSAGHVGCGNRSSATYRPLRGIPSSLINLPDLDNGRCNLRGVGAADGE